MTKKMECMQCQETVSGSGCTISGVCGKKADTANLQDILIIQSAILSKLIVESKYNKSLADLIISNLFTTITNANFDNEDIIRKIKNTIAKKEELAKSVKLDLANNSLLQPLLNYSAKDISTDPIKALQTLSDNADINSLATLTLFGLKGMSAYLHHARVLGFIDEEVDTYLLSALSQLLNNLSAEELTALTLKTGEYGVKALALLDKANTERFGNPKITEVNCKVGKRPGILISGHDLKDIKLLLEESKDAGVDIYTHSEMLPAHSYPELKKYSHLIGNYGSAWHAQKKEFEAFNGPILITTNCIVPPSDSYKDRIWTTGVVGFPGLKHIAEDKNGNKSFKEIIEYAKSCPPPLQIEDRTNPLTIGFSHSQTLELAGTVVEAIKSGAVKGFVVMAGCDGRQKSRDYYRDFAAKVPDNYIILTAGCARYRFNNLELAPVAGIPKILDAGQCNDSYSLAVIALALKEAFNLADINELPIIYNIAWYEQKAVIVLLALLHLGVKNIHLGPTLPNFITPNILNILIEKFNIGGITNADSDIKTFFKLESSNKVEKNMLVADIISAHPEAKDILNKYGMLCMGCPASRSESLEDACEVHNIDVEIILKELNK